jgi:5-(carboxyamino)imidazole ribonucleotide mutase
MEEAAQVLEKFGISYSTAVVSAHRMPLEMVAFAQGAKNSGTKVIIAGAGGAAHLPGMLAAKTIVPIFGVPVASKHLSGEDSLLSIVQMPKGIPVATFAIGEAGATNAALHVIANLAVNDPALAKKLEAFRGAQTEKARAMNLPGHS